MKHTLTARPTALCGGLVAVLFAMWYGASSQNNAAAYLLFFALASVFLVSVPRALLNLSGLNLTAESPKPVFAGNEVSLPVEVANDSKLSRYGVSVAAPELGVNESRVDEIPAGQAARLRLTFRAPARGQHEISALTVKSEYPLGFLRAENRVPCGQRYLVYPRPAGTRTLPREAAPAGHAQLASHIMEGDDFAGVRPYLAAESQRHIDWKAVARGQPLITKQYSTEAGPVLHFDYAALGLPNPEARLAQLALWIIEAERAQRRYGLRLPGTEIMPSLGEPHFHRCMRALALFK